VRFILEAPYLGGLAGARPHLDNSACQAQGLAEALDLENVIMAGYDFVKL